MNIEDMVSGRKATYTQTSLYDLLKSIMCNTDKSRYWETGIEGEGMDSGVETGTPPIKATLPTFTDEEERQRDSITEFHEEDDDGKLSEEISNNAKIELDLIPESKIPKFD